MIDTRKKRHEYGDEKEKNIVGNGGGHHHCRLRDRGGVPFRRTCCVTLPVMQCCRLLLQIMSVRI